MPKDYIRMADCPFTVGCRIKDDYQKGEPERLGRVIALNDECVQVTFDDGTSCWRTWAHEQTWNGGGGLSKVKEDVLPPEPQGDAPNEMPSPVEPSQEAIERLGGTIG